MGGGACALEAFHGDADPVNPWSGARWSGEGGKGGNVQVVWLFQGSPRGASAQCSMPLQMKDTARNVCQRQFHDP